MSKGKTEKRGPLTAQTSATDFRDFYWLKEELQDFCRNQGLSASGGKKEIEDRIEHFLVSGKRKAPLPGSAGASIEAAWVNTAKVSEFSMSTRAPRGFRCTQEVRAFFEEHLGRKFHFTVTLQNYIKEHPGVTFKEIAAEWQRVEEAKKKGEFKTEIAPQFEYNRFTRAYFEDPKNSGKTRLDCIAAWKRTRARRGDNQYRSEDHPA